MPTIRPCLWFKGNAQEAANFYISVLPDSRIDHVMLYGPDMPMPAGTVLLIELTLAGQPYQLLNGDVDFPFSEAISLALYCRDQAEVDRLWAALTADGGEEGPCGWCKDKYGLSWQVVPEAMVRMQQSGNDAAIQRATQAMMKMKKLDVATLEKAYRGA